MLKLSFEMGGKHSLTHILVALPQENLHRILTGIWTWTSKLPTSKEVGCIEVSGMERSEERLDCCEHQNIVVICLATQDFATGGMQ